MENSTDNTRFLRCVRTMIGLQGHFIATIFSLLHQSSRPSTHTPLELRSLCQIHLEHEWKCCLFQKWFRLEQFSDHMTKWEMFPLNFSISETIQAMIMKICLRNLHMRSKISTGKLFNFFLLFIIYQTFCRFHDFLKKCLPFLSETRNHRS